MTFDAVPPGQQATRMSPSASPVSKPKARASDQPISGMMANWAITPNPMSFGARITPAKSLKRRVSPMPSMITPSPTSMCGRNQSQASGSSHAQRHPSTSHAGNHEVSSEKSRGACKRTVDEGADAAG